MEIKTKFNVNNLVISKYQKDPVKRNNSELFCCYEVIDINTQTCMAGTQIFYIVRPIHGFITNEYKEGKRESKFTDFNIASYQNREYATIREDELVEASKEIIDLVLGDEYE